MLRDLDAVISAGYVMKKMATDIIEDTRSASLVMALYSSLA